jgi:uncharacterized protein (DUF1697 family)
MARYVALLRGINVGGNKKVPMAELRAMTESMGFTDVKTLLQSGNMVFTGKAIATAKLEAQLEKATRSEIGVECSYMVRTDAEWRSIIAANPYAAMAKADPSHLLVQVCKEAPSAAAVKALRVHAVPGEEIRLVGRELFICYPHGIGESKLAAALTRAVLGTPSSGRNWNTVLKIDSSLKV